MTATVKGQGTDIVEEQAQNGTAVRGTTWAALALQSNHVLGRGAQLVPWYNPDFSLKDQNATLRFRVRPRSQCVRRVWLLVAYFTGGADTANALFRAPASGGTGVVFSPSNPRNLAVFEYPEDLSSQSDDETEISCLLSATGTIEVVGLACYEAPRITLQEDGSGNDRGVDPQRLDPGDPIITTGPAGLVDAIGDAANMGRRVGHVQVSVRESDAFSTSSVSWTTMYRDVPVVGRALDLDESTEEAVTTSTISLRFRARTKNASETGKIRVTANSGDSVTTGTVSGTAWSWYPSTGNNPLELTVDSEDITSSDGRRGSTWEDLSFDFKVDSAGDTIEVASISGWED